MYKKKILIHSVCSIRMSTPFVSPDPEGTHSRQIGKRVKNRRLSFFMNKPAPVYCFRVLSFLYNRRTAGNDSRVQPRRDAGNDSRVQPRRDAGNDSRAQPQLLFAFFFSFFKFLVIGTPSAGNATLETHQAFMLCSLF